MDANAFLEECAKKGWKASFENDANGYTTHIEELGGDSIILLTRCKSYQDSIDKCAGLLLFEDVKKEIVSEKQYPKQENHPYCLDSSIFGIISKCKFTLSIIHEIEGYISVAVQDLFTKKTVFFKTDIKFFDDAISELNRFAKNFAFSGNVDRQYY